MKVRCALLAAIAGSLLLASKSLCQRREAQPGCTSVTLPISLKSGNNFEKTIGDLTFKIQPLKSMGWSFTLEDARGRDFIYPVNPSLRLNGSQTLGAGYGETSKQSMSHGRTLKFLLTESDYDAFDPYVQGALWPYAAPDPDHAIDKYLDELDELSTGLLSISIVSSDIADNDEIQSAVLNLQFVAPAQFQFASTLSPQPSTCPEETLPITQRLPSRIPQPDPKKYESAREAADWRNPYVTITRDGFDIRFQGGRLYGPLSILARTIVGLPNSVWPYGLIVAGQEMGLQSPATRVPIVRNREEADRILRELGVTVMWLPVA